MSGDEKGTLPTFSSVASLCQSCGSIEPPRIQARERYVTFRISTAFFAGILVALAAVFQYGRWDMSCVTGNRLNALVDKHVVPGTPEWHDYPATSPTNVFPSMFPTR